MRAASVMERMSGYVLNSEHVECAWRFNMMHQESDESMRVASSVKEASACLVVELAHDQVVGVPLDCVVCLVKYQQIDLAHLQS